VQADGYCSCDYTFGKPADQYPQVADEKCDYSKVGTDQEGTDTDQTDELTNAVHSNDEYVPSNCKAWDDDNCNN
jgi:hypothetical protein